MGMLTFSSVQSMVPNLPIMRLCCYLVFLTFYPHNKQTFVLQNGDEITLLSKVEKGIWILE